MEKLEPRWRKASYSGNGGQCVEVGTADRVMVRDTKQADNGPTLQFSPDAWRRFASQLKRSLADRRPVLYRGAPQTRVPPWLAVLRVR